MIVNSPHNPTGRVLSRDELQRIADFVIEHDLIAITDEVYEHLVFDGVEHIPLCTLPGMAERTLTISSLGKTFSVTGWKVGWATGPAPLVAAVRAAKQFLTFAGATPVPARGRGRAAARRRLVPRVRVGVAGQAGSDLRRAREPRASRSLGRRARTSRTPTWARDATEFARELPVQGWCRRDSHRGFQHAIPSRLAPYLRFAFCKRPAVIDAAARSAARRYESEFQKRGCVPERGSATASRRAGDARRRRRSRHPSARTIPPKRPRARCRAAVPTTTRSSRRPRAGRAARSGIVSFQSAPRKMPADRVERRPRPRGRPARARACRRGRRARRRRPSRMPRARSRAPLRCTRVAQPLVSIAMIAPTPGAANSSPTTSVPP